MPPLLHNEGLQLLPNRHQQDAQRLSDQIRTAIAPDTHTR